MDINKMIADLRANREQIEEAILSLERLARGRGKRLGRPPAWLVEVRKETAQKPATQAGKKPKKDKGGLFKVSEAVAS